ncbi:MAG: hypothetical protein ACYC40_00230 [Patescibacteria group bacterium]
MKKIANFLRTSPLKKRNLIALLGVGISLSIILIVGSFYMILAGKKVIEMIPFVFLGLLIGSATAWIVNPPVAEKWFGMEDQKNESSM